MSSPVRGTNLFPGVLIRTDDVVLRDHDEMQLGEKIERRWVVRSRDQKQRPRLGRSGERMAHGGAVASLRWPLGDRETGVRPREAREQRVGARARAAGAILPRAGARPRPRAMSATFRDRTSAPWPRSMSLNRAISSGRSWRALAGVSPAGGRSSRALTSPRRPASSPRTPSDLRTAPSTSLRWSIALTSFPCPPPSGG